MWKKAKANKTLSVNQPALGVTSPLKEQTSAIFSPLNSDTSKSGKKKLQNSTAIIRRSSRRLHHSAGNQELGPVVSEIHIFDSESEKEEDEPPVNVLSKTPEETPDETETEKNSDKESPGVADIKYKKLYINFQKKIEVLMEQNKTLNQALEHAIGKIDVYEKQSNVYSEVMDVIASLSKVNENLSAQVTHGCLNYNNDNRIKSPKRKRNGET